MPHTLGREDHFRATFWVQNKGHTSCIKGMWSSPTRPCACRKRCRMAHCSCSWGTPIGFRGL